MRAWLAVRVNGAGRWGDGWQEGPSEPPPMVAECRSRWRRTAAPVLPVPALTEKWRMSGGSVLPCPPPRLPV